MRSVALASGEGPQTPEEVLDEAVPSMGQINQTGRYDEEIDVKALQEMYKMFVVECPSGVLFLHEFKRFFGVDPTGEASDYAEAMFRAFDRNGVRSCVVPHLTIL